IVTYSLADDAGGRFAIDATTGVVTVANASLIDYETATSQSITVKAADASGAFATQTFSIAVTDAGPNAPNDANAAANTIAEDARDRTRVGKAESAADPHGGTRNYPLS